LKLFLLVNCPARCLEKATFRVAGGVAKKYPDENFPEVVAEVEQDDKKVV